MEREELRRIHRRAIRGIGSSPSAEVLDELLADTVTLAERVGELQAERLALLTDREQQERRIESQRMVIDGLREQLRSAGIPPLEWSELA